MLSLIFCPTFRTFPPQSTYETPETFVVKILKIVGAGAIFRLFLVPDILEHGHRKLLTQRHEDVPII